MKIPVMVTGVGGGGHGEQILKALKMAETDYLIVGCDISPTSKGLREVDHAYVVPAARDARYLDIILELCKKHKVRALFHGSEPELKVMSEFREEILRENILLPINLKRVIDICMSKSQTFQFLDKHSFPKPVTQIVSSLDSLRSWSEFPAILKPSVGSGGSAHTFIVQDFEELNIFGAYLMKLGVCSEIIIQEYIGTPENEYTVGVLHDLDGNFINSIAVKRDLGSTLSCRDRVPNRTGHAEFGETLAISTGVSQGAVGPYPNITRLCEEIASALGSRGPLNIQCREQNGTAYVFEINPRFSGTTSVRALVGYNEPDILIRKHLLGHRIESRFKYEVGTVVRGLAETLLIQDSSDEPLQPM